MSEKKFNDIVITKTLMFRYIISKILPFTILPIAVLSIQRYSLQPVGGIAMWWAIQLFILLVFVLAGFVFYERKNRNAVRIFTIYLLWNVFSIVRGIIIAENYWDYKGLINMTLALLMPLIVFPALNRDNVQSILSFFVKYVLPFSVFVLPFVPFGYWGWYLFPMGLLVLFIPVLKMRWKILVLVVSLLGIFCDISTRSYIFKYGIPILLLAFYYYRVFPESSKIMELTRTVFMIAPWILFYLAVSGIFNVFKINEYLKINYVATTTNTEGKVIRQDITQDSRSFIYEEVLKSAQKHNYWILGRSPARGNDTEVFLAGERDVEMRNERLRNEANATNIFTWTGVVGLVLFFLVFYRASWLALKKSNNIYAKLLGLFVAFRWMYAWVEDFYAFDLNTFVIWLMIGICFSESFRKMNNLEVKLWARGIFEKRYSKAFRVYALDNIS